MNIGERRLLRVQCPLLEKSKAHKIGKEKL
jgi:hypothetical protein